jgi:hypothetical protein
MKAKLTIEVDDNWKVWVTGPLDNKKMCLEMLDKAKDIVKTAKRTLITQPTKQDIKIVSGSTGL